jgi:hypothetical protein
MKGWERRQLRRSHPVQVGHTRGSNRRNHTPEAFPAEDRAGAIGSDGTPRLSRHGYRPGDVALQEHCPTARIHDHCVGKAAAALSNQFSR